MPNKFMMIAAGLFLAGSLVACDQYISDWAQSQPVSGKRYPPLVGWQAESQQAYHACKSVSGVVFTASGEKRRCAGFSGMSFDFLPSKPKMNADVIGLCKLNRPQAVAHCSIRNGIAEIESVVLGEYISMKKICNEAMHQGRETQGFWFRKSVVLDYGFEPKDRDAMSEYILEGVVLWVVYEPRKSRQDPQKISKVIVGEKRERFTCFVENGEVVKLDFSELGDITWNEQGVLEHFEIIDD